MNVISENRNFKFTLVLHSFVWIFFICFSLIPLYQSQYQIGIDFFVEWLSYIVVFYLNYIYLVPQFLLYKKYFSYLSIVIVTIAFFTAFRVLFIIPDAQQIMSPILFDQSGKEIFIKKITFKEAPLILKIGLSFPYLLIVITGILIKTLSEYYTNQKNKLLAESQRKTSELIYLRKQINPHFLFNSLNTIYALANKKSDLVVDAIVTLSELMRYMLYETNNQVVDLEKEIKYIKNYIELQKLRLNDIENIHIIIEGNTQNKHIEPLLLISFIENAFKYGTDYKGTTRVKIKIIIENNDLNFWVENKIEKKNGNVENSGIGISNIESRLKLLYPNAHKLNIVENDEIYTVFLNLKLDQIQIL